MPSPPLNPDDGRTLEYLAETQPSPTLPPADASSVPHSPGTSPFEPATALYGRAPLPPPGPGTLFGTYELIEKLGQGGMGVVYRARDLKLGREVALKVIRDGGFAEPPQVDRFYQEARAAARLDHPNILPIYEIDQHAGQHFFTMKLVPGGSLYANFPRYVGDAPRAAELIEKVAAAVHQAHANGILHRDLKPGNILLDELGEEPGDHAEPLVADFGLAKLLNTDTVLTQTGLPMGTPAYMAPEQAAGAGARLTPASDVWSLGVMLYELLTGVRPFAGNSSAEILSQIQSNDPAPPRRMKPKLDRGLETICLKCLHKDPERRYASAQALAADLRRWRLGEPITARRRSLAERAARQLRRKSVRAAALVLAVLAVVAVIAYQTSPERKIEADLRTLARGEPVALVVENQLPRHPRWTLGAGSFDAGPGRLLTIQAGQPSFLELLRAVPRESYRITAEVRHRDGTGAGAEVGVCFAGRAIATDAGIYQLCACFAFAEDGPRVRPRQLAPQAELQMCGQVALTLRMYRHPDRSHEIGTPLHRFFLVGVKPGSYKPWRNLVVTVSPGRVRVFWDGEGVGEITTDELNKRQRELVQYYPELNGRTDLDLQGGVGLYACKSMAQVRSLVVEPLP